jgi:predicted porin
MKKSLIILAIASAFAAPAAFAEATIYGAANVSFNSVSTGGDNNKVSASANEVSSNASVFGVKGSEDLGGGTSAIWQIETNVNLQNSNTANSTGGASGPYAGGGNQIGTNDSFAGLSGASWGTVILGQHDTPYKIATRGLDMFADTIADNRDLMGPIDGTNQIHVPNVIAYISPAFSGVTIAAAYVAGAEVPTTKTKGSAVSLAALYGAGPIAVNFGYQTLTVGTANGSLLGVTDALNVGGAATTYTGATGAVLGPNDKATAWTLGGSYTVDAFAVNAIYERNTLDTSAGNPLAALGSSSRTSYYLAGKYNVTGNDAVKLAYTHVNSLDNVTLINGGVASGAKQFAVGYDHSLSKHTSVYALYTKVTDDVGHATTMGGYDGITANVAGQLGSSPSAWSLGMKHAF